MNTDVKPDREASADPDLDRFIDALWLEDGLSGNTLAAYMGELEDRLERAANKPAAM